MKECAYELQVQLMQTMEKSSEKLHVVLEYFSFEMQFILDDY